MLLGYIRVSKADGSQSLLLQHDALKNYGVDTSMIFEDYASGKSENREGLKNCLKSLRENDILVVWKLDRLGRSLKDLVNLIENFNERKIGLKILTGSGASIDTTTTEGKLFFGFFAVLAEFERDLLIERTKAGLAAARARGRLGGRRFKLNKDNISIISAALANRQTNISILAKQFGVSRASIYNYFTPDGKLKERVKILIK